jgi:hypothetical protein
MEENVKTYSQGYYYSLVFNFDYSETELTQQRKLLGEMRLATELISFIKKEFFTNIIDVHYELYKVNSGLIAITNNETIMNDVSMFCDKLKEGDMLYNMAVKLGDYSEHNKKQIRNILDKCYTNYILSKDLNTNLKTAIKKLKV